jgi:hypothetical protein
VFACGPKRLKIHNEVHSVLTSLLIFDLFDLNGNLFSQILGDDMGSIVIGVYVERNIAKGCSSHTKMVLLLDSIENVVGSMNIQLAS